MKSGFNVEHFRFLEKHNISIQGIISIDDLAMPFVAHETFISLWYCITLQASLRYTVIVIRVDLKSADGDLWFSQKKKKKV